MSASPAGNTPGRTPNGTALPPPRRPKLNADPLVKSKRRDRRPPRPAATGTTATGAPSNVRTAVSVSNRPENLLPGSAQALAYELALDPTKYNTALTVPDELVEPSGFSSKPSADYKDYPLVMTKKQIMEGLRHHVARFISKQPVDPLDENQFTRPVRLARRDLKDLEVKKEVDVEGNEVDEEERQKQQLLKAQRDAEKEAQMAQVAPSVNSSGKRRLGPSNKKTQSVFAKDQTEEQRHASRLRYEEALQWVLEDFDGKQSWLATYEAAMSENYARIHLENGKFYATPLEKWYKFTVKSKIQGRTLEEAEKELKKLERDPSLIKRAQEASMNMKTEEENRKRGRKLYVGRIKQESEDFGASRAGEGFDELDFDEDRFADDEEPDLFEGDTEELKRTEQRIKSELLSANVFDMKDEKSIDRAELMEKKEKLAQKEHGKRVRKALKKRERNYVYESDDSDKNPYSEESESTDSEAERQKEEQEKKEAEEKAKGSQPQSGASTKGNNTPSGRASKHSDPNRLRPGSTNASDASGNESSRKKSKKLGGSKLGTGTNTPNGNKSRSRSPAPGVASENLKKKIGSNYGVPDPLKKRPRTTAGSGSEGEGAGSGGEMSDTSRKRIKMNPNNTTSAQGSPGTSRSPSVEPGARATSPSQSRALPPMPTAAQITAAIPDEGISMVKLFRMYGGQDKKRKADLIRLLKPLSRYDAATKMLKRVNRHG